ncbi:MAG: chorismate mutase [Pseudomonadota bacterium]
MESLEALRQSVDEVDQSIIKLFAKRFSITDQVGRYKAQHGLPPKDTTREYEQLEHIRSLAAEHGVEPEVAGAYLRAMLDAVVARHEALQSDDN